MSKLLTEQLSLAEAATSADRRSGRMTIQVMTPGWGSSGYYSPEVCESAADLVKVGTQMYLDHPTDAEAVERPARSVRDIAAIVTEDARWDVTAQAVIAECQVTAPYREFLADENLAPHIGLSIRGSATDITVGEAEGRTGPIVEGLADITSVDFVTRAGRGGKVLQVLESARPSVVIERAIGRGVEEATADERRQQLSDAIRTAHAGEGRYAWVRDFDESTVWFEASADDEPSKTWEQAYSVADDDMSVSLTGERTEVRPVTKYVPATRSDSTTTATTESEEDTMPKIQIEESEHTRLVEQAGRVDALQQENTSLKAENGELKEAAAVGRRRDRARVVVSERAKEAGVEFTPLEVRGLIAELPLTESGELDEAKFATAVDEDAAAKKTAAGVGQVHGFGTEVGIPDLSEGDLTVDDLDNTIGEAFGRTAAGTQVKEA